MNLGLFLGAWVFTQYRWKGVWITFFIWIALDVLLYILWPDMEEDIVSLFKPTGATHD